MNKEDFKLCKRDITDVHEDYWFKVSGETKEYLTKEYMEQSMIDVIEVVYSKDEDIVGVKRLFPFNYNVVISDDIELKQTLVNLVDEIIKEDK